LKYHLFAELVLCYIGKPYYVFHYWLLLVFTGNSLSQT